MSDEENYDSDNESGSESETEIYVDTSKPKKTIFKTPQGEEVVDSEEDDADISDNEEQVSDDEDVVATEFVFPDEEEEEDDDDVSEPESDVEEEDVVPATKSKKAPATKKPKKQLMILDDEEDDEDEEYNENYLEKFDADLVKNYIDDFHPECFHHNYDEITKLSIVIRNSDGIIVDPLHRTIPYLTKYERARILGQRAKQIETGAKPFVKVPENIVDGYIIAELELKEKKIPFIIKRPIPGGACEYWNLKDLEVIAF